MKSRIIVAAIIEKNGEILLGRKPDDVGPYPNTWHIPGGGVDLDDETLEEALRREIKEETGLEVGELENIGFDEDKEPDKYNELTHYIFLVFKTTVKRQTEVAGDDINKLKWVKKSELHKFPLTRPSQKLFKKLGWLK